MRKVILKYLFILLVTIFISNECYCQINRIEILKLNKVIANKLLEENIFDTSVTKYFLCYPSGNIIFEDTFLLNKTSFIITTKKEIQRSSLCNLSYPVLAKEKSSYTIYFYFKKRATKYDGNIFIERNNEGDFLVKNIWFITAIE